MNISGPYSLFYETKSGLIPTIAPDMIQGEASMVNEKKANFNLKINATAILNYLKMTGLGGI